ncbi:hypothetical protein C5B42_02005 [Candidatus Cerribacteria bacterium 'Amazon FNV 2010 28 9']|uniref:Uncharacterized protein n=1 Tax=Candidatus Cerribacteria bacterium 'Amazon FNV 2010 28 9' TaxID=2081795 RepID=A0A317JPL9_9BACT|nr:MAG: hypothetical protein C5B42_02005 [Candidatus Cerribacteria bacterium 'Amazon FNV 2010 28 9']
MKSERKLQENAIVERMNKNELHPIHQESMNSLARTICRLRPSEVKTRFLPPSILLSYCGENGYFDATTFIQDLRIYTLLFAKLNEKGLFFNPSRQDRLHIAVIDNELIQLHRLPHTTDALEQTYEEIFPLRQ